MSTIRTYRPEDFEAVVALFEANVPQYFAPEEVAETVLWLCRDAARGVTGQAIAVSGGET